MVQRTMTDAVGEHPRATFEEWYEKASRSGAPLPETMALATTGLDGTPRVRMVLYKGWSEGGLRFFTNYESPKARELEQLPVAAVVFYWDAIKRQVRFEGRVERLSAQESDAYFALRPRLSQIGAWASRQSAVVDSREELDAAFQALADRFEGKSIPRPEWWGGYRLLPRRAEFWIGRDHRLHDRFEIEQTETGWVKRVLSP